jgi:hypothetical protein
MYCSNSKTPELDSPIRKVFVSFSDRETIKLNFVFNDGTYIGTIFKKRIATRSDIAETLILLAEEMKKGNKGIII